MNNQQFTKLLNKIQKDELEVREQGQKEYAHDENNVFANFDRIANNLNLTREQVLVVYLQKHIDGIIAYVNGHKSQREDIRGRIKDTRMYLALLYGMVEDTVAANTELREMIFGEKGYFNW